MKNVEKNLRKKIEQALENDLSQEEILKIAHISIEQVEFWNRRKLLFTSLILFLGLLLVLSFAYLTGCNDAFAKQRCLLYHTSHTLSVTRPLSKCSFCKDIQKIPVFGDYANVSHLQDMAFHGHPFVIRKIAKDWPAMKYLNMRYLTKLFDNDYFYKENAKLRCQFFSYKSKFKHLRQVMYWIKKSKEKIRGQFYVGWSNCVSNVSSVLRKQYRRLPFITDYIHSSNVDWIFIGGGGHAANMHIDTVGTLSWQVVLRGRKTWYLEPPPECECVCKRHLGVTLNPGDAIIIDTNTWFHSTYIHPSYGISIAIGSEFS